MIPRDRRKTRDHALASRLDLARDFASRLDLARDFASRLDLARDLDLASYLASLSYLVHHLGVASDLASDLSSVSDLSSDLDFASVSDLASISALELAGRLERALARAGNIGLVITSARVALDRAHDSDLARALGSDLARDLASHLGRHLVSRLDRDIVSLLLDRDLDRDLARLLDRDLTRDLARDLTAAVVDSRKRAFDLLNYLDGCVSRARDGERRAEVRVAPTAGRLVAAAARMLPPGDRARYSEELQAELWEIARAGGGRRPQLAYAARQLAGAPRLRAGLRAPRRRGALP